MVLAAIPTRYLNRVQLRNTCKKNAEKRHRREMLGRAELTEEATPSPRQKLSASTGPQASLFFWPCSSPSLPSRLNPVCWEPKWTATRKRAQTATGGCFSIAPFSPVSCFDLISTQQASSPPVACTDSYNVFHVCSRDRFMACLYRLSACSV